MKMKKDTGFTKNFFLQANQKYLYAETTRQTAYLRHLPGDCFFIYS